MLKNHLSIVSLSWQSGKGEDFFTWKMQINMIKKSATKKCDFNRMLIFSCGFISHLWRRKPLIQNCITLLKKKKIFTIIDRKSLFFIAFKRMHEIESTLSSTCLLASKVVGNSTNNVVAEAAEMKKQMSPLLMPPLTWLHGWGRFFLRIRGKILLIFSSYFLYLCRPQK